MAAKSTSMSSWSPLPAPLSSPPRLAASHGPLSASLMAFHVSLSSLTFAALLPASVVFQSGRHSRSFQFLHATSGREFLVEALERCSIGTPAFSISFCPIAPR